MNVIQKKNFIDNSILSWISLSEIRPSKESIEDVYALYEFCKERNIRIMGDGTGHFPGIKILRQDDVDKEIAKGLFI